MIYSGNLKKMRCEADDPVSYYIEQGEAEICINDFLGKQISIKHNGLINCIVCGKQMVKSYSQGFCYDCLTTAPEADESVFRPELSKAHLGIARDMDWAIEHDLIDHYVYLAFTSEVKVGVTRYNHLFTRWMDQGAIMGIKMFRTPNRHIAGIIEVFLKKYVTDKTNWSKMLKGGLSNSTELHEEKKRLTLLMPNELRKYFDDDNTIYYFNYPILKVPTVLRQINFDENRENRGILVGIKGQYLIFEDGKVLNVRRHSGYFTEISLI